MSVLVLTMLLEEEEEDEEQLEEYWRKLKLIRGWGQKDDAEALLPPPRVRFTEYSCEVSRTGQREKT